jgi:4-aminobutyrate--pyruvate transaminase
LETRRRKTSDFRLILGASNLARLRNERPLVFVRGKGIFLWDEAGREYLEASSSFYCAALGFSDSEISDAAVEQLRRLPFSISAGHRTTDVTVELSERLAAFAPFPNARIAFANSGSEANDALIKFVRFANVARGESKRRKIICRAGSYHGCTTLLAGLGSSRELQQAFGLVADDIITVSQPDLRNALPGESTTEFLARIVAELEEAIVQAGPETIAAFIAEPVSFSAGFVIPPLGYFQSIAQVLRRYRIRLLADEIVTGFYRLGTPMGWQVLDVPCDGLTVGKALTAAFAPMGALLIDESLYDELCTGTAQGLFGHVSTYAGHPLCAAVALRVLQTLERRGIDRHVAAIQPRFRQMLESLRTHVLVSNTRALGLAGAVALKIPDTKASLAMWQIASAVQACALARGLLVRLNGDVVILAPPLIIDDAEIVELGSRLRSALDGARSLLETPERIVMDPTVTHPNRSHR